MNDKEFKRIRVWITGQERPVIATFPAGEEPIQACSATPDFVKIRNVLHGGDWILPKRDIKKAQVMDLNNRQLSELDLEESLSHKS